MIHDTQNVRRQGPELTLAELTRESVRWQLTALSVTAFTQPRPGRTAARRDQVIYYQYKADRARRPLRGIDEQVRGLSGTDGRCRSAARPGRKAGGIVAVGTIRVVPRTLSVIRRLYSMDPSRPRPM
jgi:hypothetical protein